MFLWNLKCLWEGTEGHNHCQKLILEQDGNRVEYPNSLSFLPTSCWCFPLAKPSLKARDEGGWAMPFIRVRPAFPRTQSRTVSRRWGGGGCSRRWPNTPKCMRPPRRWTEMHRLPRIEPQGRPAFRYSVKKRDKKETQRRIVGRHQRRAWPDYLNTSPGIWQPGGPH